MKFWTAELKNSPIGPIGLAASERGVARISFFGLEGIGSGEGVHHNAHGVPIQHSDVFSKRFSAAGISQDPPPGFLLAALCQIEEYLLGRRRVFDFPLDLEGFTTLSGQVLAACKAIPFGVVKTYRQIAVDLGRPAMARFVGTMMAENPLPLVIPCHRVVGSDRLLHGFGAPGGLTTKAWLLSLEGHHLDHLRLIA
jgi:methylated-DNA-[protein]-cysteine S-methyltransferase